MRIILKITSWNRYSN